MPPVLGWAAVTGEVTTEAMLLFLIIFAWTPPHFWSLALYRTEDYARAGVPMLPVTHGKEYTRLQVLLYTIILFAFSLLPFAVRMSGWLYLAAAVLLGTVFLDEALSARVIVGMVVVLAGVALHLCREPDAPRPFRAWGYPWAPAILVAFRAVMVVNEMIRNGRTAIFGAIVILLGIPVYFLFRRSRP